MERRVVLATKRLTLTTWLADDLDDLHRLHSDPDVMHYIGGRPEPREESATRLGRYLDEQDGRGWTKWRVQAHDGRMVGRAGFGSLGEDRDLGYTLERAAWGQGLATELAIALVQWHRANPGHRVSDGNPVRLGAYADADHAASLRVMSKAGLRFVDVHDHQGCPCAFYRLDDAE
jgi:RimJ/RimL family protein N-acetyltransferase